MSQVKPLSILVTGGAGFVGSAVVPALRRRGHRVVATTRRPSLVPNAPGLTWARWDAREEALPAVDWSGLDGVIHLAAVTVKATSTDARREQFAVTIDATFRLLEAAREHGLERFVLGSTGDVLGRSSDGSEANPEYHPESFYATSKACAELLCRSNRSRPAGTVLRFYHPYGPGGDRFLVNRLLAAVAADQEVEIDGSDGIWLDPVWVEDLAEGVCLAVEAGLPDVFHLAGAETVSLRRLLVLMGERLGRSPRIRSRPAVEGDTHVGRWERAARMLGFDPRTSLFEGLGRLLASRSKGCDA